MRSGKWRGVTLALGVACTMAFLAGVSNVAQAQDFHTIPRLVPGVDINTGGPYMAPPIPYGHYAGKNLGGKVGKIKGLIHGKLSGLGHGGLGGGCADGSCGGAAGGCEAGHGLFKKGCLGGMKGCSDGNCGHGGEIIASAQGMPTAQCGTPGCDTCGGGSGDPCGSCGGRGCGLCGLGKGLGGLCGSCGGAGCSACLAKAKGMVHHLLGRDRIKWFTGAGGPVPLTPGYTPYVITTRSPRDFFAFPPMTP